MKDALKEIGLLAVFCFSASCASSPEAVGDAKRVAADIVQINKDVQQLVVDVRAFAEHSRADEVPSNPAK